MAKHKAPTQVTIAPTEEQSAFAGFVHRAWKPFAAIALVFIAFSVFGMISDEQEVESNYADWNLLSTELSLDLTTGELSAETKDIAGLRSSIAGSAAEPWAVYLGAVALAKEGDWTGAESQLADLERDFPKHTLNTGMYEFDGADSTESLIQRFKRVVADQKAWEINHPELIANPSLAEGAPRVRIVTDEGPIVVGLYPGLAPKHCENFLKLCGEGFYDGTLFHRVVPSAIIQAGDPNTKTEDQSTWGNGGPGYTIESEKSGLYHFEGALAAAKKPQEQDSSGSQFYLTVADVHGLDDQYVVFGAILEGLENAVTIGEGEVTAPDSPIVPVKILSTDVL